MANPTVPSEADLTRTIPPPPQPGRDLTQREPYQPTQVRSLWLISAVVVGLLADQALRRPPWHNVATALFFAGLAIALLISGFLKQRSAQAAAGGAIIFSAMLAVRSDPRLTAFNILACLFLLLVAAALSKRGSVWNYRPLEILNDGLTAAYYAAETMFLVPLEIGARARQAKENDKHGALLGIARGIMLAAPILLILGLLLASADAIFSSFFDRFSIPVGSVVGHLTLISIGALAAAALFRISHQGTQSETPEMKMRLGQTESGIILGGLVLLFATFAIAQAVGLAGAGEAALEAAGLTFKEYARQGFFQLLWVAGITLVIVVSLHTVTETSGRGNKWIRLLSGTAVILTLLIVGVAFGRLWLYVADDGLTPLRFYSAAFSIWVGAAFLIVAARMLGYRAEQAWLMPALVTSGLVALLALNAANPEAIIAKNNLDRNRPAMLAHMEKLSGDGLAVIASNIDDLNPELRAEVTEQLCDRRTRSRGGQLGRDVELDFGEWNLGTSRGRAALAELCD